MSSRVKWSVAVLLWLVAIGLGVNFWERRQMPEVAQHAPQAAPRPEMLGGLPVPAGGGYRVPRFGTRQSIIGLYQAPDGRLIYELFYYQGREARTDYWDPHLKRLLFPDQAHAMATSPGSRLAASLRPKSWKKIERKLFNAQGPDGLEVGGSYEGGSLCHWAYSTSTDIESLGDVPSRFVLFRKRDTPEHWSSPCGGPDADLHYEEIVPRVVATDRQGFLATLDEESILLMFDWDGRAPFLKGQDRIIAVPYRALREAHGQTDGEVVVAKAEALIERTGRDQKRGILADLKWSE